MADATRVLIVEDEEPIREGLAVLFDQQGYDVTSVADGLVALDRLAASPFDLVVLDLMIPGADGLEVLRRVRAGGNRVSVLILTAKGTEDDVVAGLEAGADDYVTKPFGIRELVARAHGLLRRTAASPEAPRQLSVDPAVTVDLDLLTVTWGSEQLRLTAREGLLLEHLVVRRHRAVTRQELLVDVWGYRDGTMLTRTVDVHIQQLRSKLREVPGGDDWIETVRGKGYRFGGVAG